MAGYTHLPDLRVQRLEVAPWNKAKGSRIGGGGLQIDSHLDAVAVERHVGPVVLHAAHDAETVRGGRLEGQSPASQ